MKDAFGALSISLMGTTSYAEDRTKKTQTAGIKLSNSSEANADLLTTLRQYAKTNVLM